MEKDQMMSGMEQERQQLVRELEELQARHTSADNDDSVGQSKHLMDLAAGELAKLKTSNVSLHHQLADLQNQLDQQEHYAAKNQSYINSMRSESSAGLSAQIAEESLSQLEAQARVLEQALREETSLRQHAQQQARDAAGEIQALHENLMSLQQQAQKLQFDLIDSEERLKEAAWQLREVESNNQTLHTDLTLARDEVDWLQQVLPCLLSPRTPPLLSPVVSSLLNHARTCSILDAICFDSLCRALAMHRMRSYI